MSKRTVDHSAAAPCHGGTDEGQVPHDQLPAYAPLLAARHAAHEPELRTIVSELPLQAARLVIDVPSGDGFFSRCLADSLSEKGRVVAADISIKFLKTAQSHFSNDAERLQAFLVKADSYELPFSDNRFDLGWCAQSLLTLKQPLVALRELKRIVRPGGYVAILEEDRVNEMLLPWPADLRRAVRKAEQRALADSMNHHSADANPARHMQRLIQQAGLAAYRRSTYAIERSFPLKDIDQRFLQHYFAALRQRISPYLTQDEKGRLDRLADPESAEYLPQRPDFQMTWQEIVSVGLKP